MDSISSYYNTLFTIEISVFGIIAAAFFVFLQIVYSQYSYREVNIIIKNGVLITYFIVSSITTLMTAVGTFLVAFPSSTLLSWAFAYTDCFRNALVSFVLLVLFFISLALFAVYTFLNLRIIRPSKIALLIGRRITPDRLINHLLLKYGFSSPNDWPYALSTYFIPNSALTPPPSSVVEQSERREGAQKEYARVKKKIANAQDPMEPLHALMLKSINNMDLATIKEIQTVLIQISASFMKDNRLIVAPSEWSPYRDLTRVYLEYLTDLFRVYIEMSERQKSDSIKMELLDTSGQIANQVVTYKRTDVEIIFSLWKAIADDALGKSPVVFSKIIQLYRSLGDWAFDNGVEEEKWTYSIFRDLGWLAERMITRQGIEQKPLMINYDYSNSYDHLLEAILSYSGKYDKRPNSYPLIYFDTVQAFLSALLPVYKTQCRNDLKDTVFDCLLVFSYFAEAAIPIGNSQGAGLALWRLKDMNDELLEHGLDESAKQAVILFVRIAAKAYDHKQTLKVVDFLDQPIDEYAIRILLTNPYHDSVIHEISEAFIHRDASWEFVVEMGKHLQTNFGFMFEWQTGELYTKDDPRRK